MISFLLLLPLIKLVISGSFSGRITKRLEVFLELVFTWNSPGLNAWPCETTKGVQINRRWCVFFFFHSFNQNKNKIPMKFATQMPIKCFTNLIVTPKDNPRWKIPIDYFDLVVAFGHSRRTNIKEMNEFGTLSVSQVFEFRVKYITVYLYPINRFIF